MKKFLLKLSNLITGNAFDDKEISLVISQPLKDFVEDEVLPGLNFSSNYFWLSLESIIEEFSIRNDDLLNKRKSIQKQIDNWHIERKHSGFDLKE